MQVGGTKRLIFIMIQTTEGSTGLTDIVNISPDLCPLAHDCRDARGLPILMMVRAFLRFPYDTVRSSSFICNETWNQDTEYLLSSHSRLS